jgi:hypothetical protein
VAVTSNQGGVPGYLRMCRDEVRAAMTKEAGRQGCDGLVMTQQGPINTFAACIVYTEK